MPYLGNGYLGSNVAPSQADMSLLNYKEIYAQLKNLGPAQLAQIAAEADRTVAALPASDRQYVRAVAQQTSETDPRTASGLGVFGLDQVAKIAATVATLGTLGIQIKGTMDATKQAKKQASAQKAQTKAETAAAKATEAAALQQQPAPSFYTTPSFILPAALIGGGLAILAVIFALRRKA